MALLAKITNLTGCTGCKRSPKNHSSGRSKEARHNQGKRTKLRTKPVKVRLLKKKLISGLLGK